MNIFAIDSNPKIAAKWLVDKHIVRMPLETGQLLCSVYYYNTEAPVKPPYKLTHANHPCSIWARQSLCNFSWLCLHGIAICKEYTARYGKRHKSQDVIEWCENHKTLLKFSSFEQTPFPLAMPEAFKSQDAIESYKRYYKEGKKHLHQWKQNKPHWIFGEHYEKNIE